jgi:hypothetical protein
MLARNGCAVAALRRRQPAEAAVTYGLDRDRVEATLDGLVELGAARKSDDLYRATRGEDLATALQVIADHDPQPTERTAI